MYAIVETGRTVRCVKFTTFENIQKFIKFTSDTSNATYSARFSDKYQKYIYPNEHKREEVSL